MDLQIETKVNHGVILGRRETDYVAGTGSAIPYEVRNPSGDWTIYLPTVERQSNRRVDTMACVSYSFLNVIETQAKFYGQYLNLSDRFLAKLSDTTSHGNYLWKVADTARLKGLVPQELWPEPEDYTWESYYASIPTAIQSKGLEFLDNWSIAYEWVEVSRESLLKHLKHAPLQIVIPGHAVMSFFSNWDVIHYFDTYDPFLKKATVNQISDALKIVLTPKKSMPEFIHIQGTNEYGLLYKSEFVTTIVRFTSETDAKEKLKTTKIDYSKARDINI